MSPPGSRAREAREREAREAEHEDYQLREPLLFREPARGSLCLLERLAFASATRDEIDRIDKEIVTAFNRHHWHRDNCPHHADLERHVRNALIRRGMKVGGKKRVAKLVRLIRNKALSRIKPDDEDTDPYWWR